MTKTTQNGMVVLKMTAREMALTSHWLSKRAMNATTNDGRVWSWSDEENCWVWVR